jgi:tRNA-dihydrouridine synthase A
VPFAVNGGIRDADVAVQALQWCDSVMIGREAYHRPWLLAELQARCYAEDAVSTPQATQVLQQMTGYAAQQLAQGERLSSITRHMLGLLTHTAGARDWRRLLYEGARSRETCVELLQQAEALL